MHKIRPSCENEMVHEFLKMELDSARFAEGIESALRRCGVDKGLITSGDIKSERENALRTKVLGLSRGYGMDDGVFINYPSSISWFWVVLNKHDAAKTLYIEYSYWNELSNYTGSPIEAAKAVLQGKTAFDIPNDNFVNIHQKLKGGAAFPPLIMLTDPSEQRYILLEGHTRMTGFCIDTSLFNNIPALLGYCNDKELGRWYGKMPQRP